MTIDLNATQQINTRYGGKKKCMFYINKSISWTKYVFMLGFKTVFMDNEYILFVLLSLDDKRCKS